MKEDMGIKRVSMEMSSDGRRKHVVQTLLTGMDYGNDDDDDDDDAV
jgi:hypothetical protein